jgi:hypothetical protein
MSAPIIHSLTPHYSSSSCLSPDLSILSLLLSHPLSINQAHIVSSLAFRYSSSLLCLSCSTTHYLLTKLALLVSRLSIIYRPATHYLLTGFSLFIILVTSLFCSATHYLLTKLTLLVARFSVIYRPATHYLLTKLALSVIQLPIIHHPYFCRCDCLSCFTTYYPLT